MAEPTIHFNPSTGSDTAASGAGPGDGTTGGSAVTGTAAAHTNGAGSTTITLTNTPDLSAVLTDGSHALWLNTASGRQWSKITGKDDGADTVTVADSFNIGSGSAVDYAIGGKRNTIEDADSRQLFADAKPAWTIDLEDGTYTLTSVINWGVSGDGTGPITVLSSTATRATITSATSGIDLFRNNGFSFWRYKHLKFTHTGATRGEAISPNNIQHRLDVVDCVVDGCLTLSDGDFGANYSWLNLNVIDTEIRNCTGTGLTNFSGRVFLLNCYIHDNASHGIRTTENGSANCSNVFINCVVTDNGGRGIYHTTTTDPETVLMLANCTVANNTGSGLEAVFTAGPCKLFLTNSIFYGNGAYGALVSGNVAYADERYCAYGSNTTADRSGLTAGDGAVTLTADPFTASGSGDYTLNATAGGGAACRGAGFPGAWDSATMTGANAIGALQVAASGGSGGAYAFAFCG